MKEKPETKQCKHCKTEIPYDAKVCPNCRKKQKSNVWLMIVVAVAAICVLGSCFAGGSSQNKEVKKNKETKSAENELIEEQVLLEWEGLKVTAKEFVIDSIWGKGIKVLIENDTDKNLGVGCKELIVNDYMITDLFSESVAAGKKSNGTIYMSSNQLKAAGIDRIGQVEIYFHIYDGDSYSTLYDSDRIVIQTSEYANMDTKINDEGEELLNQDGIRIVAKYVDESSIWGKAVLLYIENNSGRNVGVNCDDMSVNGFMVSPLFSSTVYNGKKALSDITLFSSTLEENGIDEVKDIELKFHVYDADSYDTIFDSDTVAFSVQ